MDILSVEDFEEYWLNSAWFEGDPLITEEKIAKIRRSGGFSTIINLEKGEDGILRGRRDIILQRIEE